MKKGKRSEERKKKVRTEKNIGYKRRDKTKNKNLICKDKGFSS